MTGRRSPGTSLAEIYLRNEWVIREQSECIKREFEKYFQGSHRLPQAHKKCVMKMKKETRKNDVCIKFNVFNGRK